VRRLPGYPIYALDLPGHGKSEGRGYQQIEPYARRVIDWMDARKIYRAVIVGHSMGSAIAITLGSQFPERILGLGLIGAGARLRVNANLLNMTSRPEQFSQAVEFVASWAFHPETDPQLIKLAAERMSPVRPTVLHNDFLACNAFNAADNLEQLEMPCLVLCGARDRLTPPRFSEYLAGKIPNAQLAIIPETGHMVQLERPSAVAEALQAF